MHVYYNGVYIKNCLMTACSDEVIYDQSGVNLIGNRYTFTFECCFFPKRDLENTRNDMSTGTLYDEDSYYSEGYIAFGAVRRALLIPRKEFIVLSGHHDPDLQKPGGISYYPYLYSAIPYGKSWPDFVITMENTNLGPITDDILGGPGALRVQEAYDIENGPLPKSVEIIESMPHCIRYKFTIASSTLDCTHIHSPYPRKSINNDIKPVLSNRWTCEETLDRNWFTTRTYTGKLRAKDPRYTPHLLRKWCVPPLEYGFVRESIRFSETSDGLGLEYTITDKQVKTAPPPPATSWKGSFTIDHICMSYIEVKLTFVLEAPPHISARVLRDRALSIIKARIANEALVRAQKTAIKTSQRNISENNGTGNEGTEGNTEEQTIIPIFSIIIFNLSLTEHFGDMNAISASVKARIIPDCYSTDEEGNVIPSKDANQGFIDKYWKANYDLIGLPWLMDNVTDEDGVRYYYRHNNIGNKPDPFGYNSNSKIPRNVTTGFIRSLASVACEGPSSVFNRVNGTNDEPANEGRLDTLPQEQDIKVTYDPPGTSYAASISMIDEDAKTYLQTYYKSTVKYDCKQFKVQLPSATPISASSTKERLSSATCSVIELAQPMNTAHVVIEAEQVGNVPELPDPYHSFTGVSTKKDRPGIMFEPLSHKVDLCEPISDSMGSRKVYHVKAEYSFAMSRAMEEGDGIQILYPGFTKISPEAVSTDRIYNGRQLSHIKNISLEENS